MGAKKRKNWCTHCQKTTYRNFIHAFAIARKIEEKERLKGKDLRLRLYWCKISRGYHLTHQPFAAKPNQ